MNSSLPLSFAQQGLWFLHELEPDSSAYNVARMLSFKGKLNEEALSESLNRIIERHEVLRTTIGIVDGQPSQLIATEARLLLEAEDLTTLPAAERLDIALAGARAEAERPFDLRQGPLLRARLLRLAEREQALLLCLHHIVCDGWSMEVLFAELEQFYNSSSTGEPARVKELPVQYADYALWQRERLTGAVLTEELNYWREQLGGELGVLELPTDRVRPARQSGHGGVERQELGTELTERLQSLAREHGASLFMVLLAALQTLLWRYTGAEQVVVGTPVANRQQVEVEDLIGFFVNTLALRSRLRGELRFTELLAQVKETCLGAYRHQELPFEKLVEELQPERSLAHAPLVQVTLTMLGAARKPLELHQLETTIDIVHSATSKRDLSFYVEETPAGGLQLWLEYNADLFDAATVQMMLRHYQMLLESVVSEPAHRLWELPFLSDAERQELIVEWNKTKVEFPRDRCVHELFEAQVEQTPESIAVKFGEQKLSYRELNANANQLAHYLIEQGVKPEDRVGLLLERSLEMVVSLLAVLKAGACYVPLDPEYPRQRLDAMIEDADLKLILTHESFPELAAYRADNPRVTVHPDNAAYVMYTSGSTGKPKGVAVTHRGIVRLVKGANYVSLGAEDVLVQLAPLSFDASTFEIWSSLLSGAKLIIVPPGQLSLEELRQIVAGNEVTILWLTTRLFHLLVNEGLAELKTLRQVLTGGEVISPEQVEKFLESAGHTSLIHVYGPTENTTFTTYYPMQGARKFAASVPIGRPISNTRMYVLDGQMQLAPRGVMGELYIGGDGLARGYFNRPDLTAESFVPDPFSCEPGARLYRSGDRVRYLADGALEFCGRLDHQVKVRGFRIEPQEIEAVLRQHEAVSEAVVIAREDATRDKHLVAYWVPRNGQVPDDLRAFLREQVPEYMVPSTFVRLEQLPLSPHGKVDRRALLLIDESETQSNESFIAPRNKTEQMLAEICSELLWGQKVGVGDNFFELGGNSLVVIQLASRIRNAFAVDLDLPDIFLYPTVAEIAELIDAARPDASVRITPRSRNQLSPLSFSQQRLWFIDQLYPGNFGYNITKALRLQGPLDVAALERSLAEIVRRHESFRTSFTVIDGQPVQVTEPLQPFEIKWIEPAESSSLTEAVSLIRKEAQRPFDLSQGKLLRANLLPVGTDDYVLALVMHHIATDGWSLEIFSRELAALYEANITGQTASLPELEIQYADYAAWQREQLQGERLQQEVTYWRKQLADLPELMLPTDFERPNTESFAGALHCFTLSSSITEGLKARSVEEDVTVYMLLLAAFEVLLYSYLKSDDIAVGSPTAGRDLIETENLIGFFVNTLVLRTSLANNPTFRELLHRVRAVTLEAYAHSSLPFDKLVEELRPRREPNRTPLYQVQFAYQNVPPPVWQLAGLTVDSVNVDPGTAHFDLVVLLSEVTDGLRCTFDYRTDLFKRETIIRMAARFEALLRQVAKGVDDRLTDLLNSAECTSTASFKRIKRKPLQLGTEDAIWTLPSSNNHELPLLVKPDIPDLNLAVWAARHQASIQRALLQHGGLLFRDTNIKTAAEFEQFITAISGALVPYDYRSTPRRQVEGMIYTSTEYPADQSIPLHNEMSYARAWPMRIYFYCKHPATQGGDTPLADSRKIFRRLAPAITEKFRRRKVMYVRNYGDGVDLSWCDVFQTNDKAEVESYCRQAGIEAEWNNGILRTREICPAVAVHPNTGETVWFNEAHLFHVSSLPSSIRESLVNICSDCLPRNAFYGDGAPIEDSVLKEIREAYLRETVTFRWQAGDVLLLDNMLTAHGRFPFTGPREVLVGMAESYPANGAEREQDR